ncbi:hypothetical protein J6TS7_21580 [Paenibacillus dendritiformis]|uniref:hypothetical protein n=1 Tax=Paenibacillus TaxID=44249 RepID=UPI001B018641|nr:hypothetical protein [Paenibacillus dendritiformis]GIO78548.1 hypothetical protein J6TS7_21580 [Paenibacillus dendritiformis]
MKTSKNFEFMLDDFELPVKRELPALRYDIATYCDNVLKITKRQFPPYLSDLKQKMSDYAKQRKAARPQQFEPFFRIYVVDHRLHIPVALLDPDGSIANWCWKFAKYDRQFDEYVYGDGELIGPDLIQGQWSIPILKNFIKQYGFAPIEELAMPSLLIFVNQHLDDVRTLAHWQVNYMLMKYRDSNLVDWEAILTENSFTADYLERLADFD